MLSRKLYKLTSTKILIIAIVLFISFVALVMPRVADYTARTVGDGSPDLSFYYTADDLYDMADSYGESGRRIYVTLRFTFDLIFPLIYLFFLVTVISRLLEIFPIESKLRYINIIPVIGTLFDYLENIGASIVVGRYPVKSGLIATITPYLSMIKWTLLGLSFLLIIIIGIYAIILRLSKKAK